MQFSSLNISSSILAAVEAEGYETPTPIQAQAIPPALEGRDVLGCAQTGTGKTAAFAIPILQHLDVDTEPTEPRAKIKVTPPSRGVRQGRGNPRKISTRRPQRLPRALILSPTRELATQIGDAFATYGQNTRLTHTVIFGGVSQARQERALMNAPDIIVATPGRLIDLMEQGVIDLSDVNHFVLDEADRMLDMGFIQPIRKIAQALISKRQTLLFSATMPREIMKLADSLLDNPVKVKVSHVASAAPLIEQAVHMVGRGQKQSLLEHLIATHDIRRALVFTKTKHGADKVAKRLENAGVSADAIHGNKSQRQRERALNAFRSGRARVLVATDVAARGIDVDAITHVFNFDIPIEPESYVHRIGRTGRAGATGLAIAFCDRDERSNLRAIEKLTGLNVPVIETPGSLSTEKRAPRGDHAPRVVHVKPRSENRANRNGGSSRTRSSNASGGSAGGAKAARTRTRKSDVPSSPSGPGGSRSSRGPSRKAGAGAGAGGGSKSTYGKGPSPQRGRRTRSR